MSLEETGKEKRGLRASLDYERKYVSVTWSVDGSNDEPFERYEIELQKLSESTDKIRQTLDRLQSMPLAKQGDFAPYRSTLVQLADAGTELYELLMTGNEDDPLSGPAAKEFREWFEDEVLGSGDDIDWRIHFVHPDNADLIVPWGLVCTPDTVSDSGASPDDFPGFWSLAYRATCSVVARSTLPENSMKRTDVRLSAFMEDGSVHTSHTVNQAADETKDRDRLYKVLVPSADEVLERVRSLRSYDQFWYFWLEPDSEISSKGDRSLISAEDLLEHMGGSAPQDRIVFLLLDGDAVIRKDRGPEWLSAALKLGRSGLVAVEADITNEELRCLGWSILRHVLSEGISFVQAMEEIRLRLWPHSMLYGVYCDPSEAYADPPDKNTIAVMDEYMTNMGYRIHNGGPI